MRMKFLGFSVCALVFAGLLCATGAENTGISNALTKSEDTATQELRSYLQLQEQLHATELAVERNRKEGEITAAQNAEALSARLQALEQSIGTARSRELDAMQSSNRVMLIVAGSFAAMGFVAMLLMAWFQWRTVNRLAEISAAMSPGGLALPAPRPIAALLQGDAPVSSSSALVQPQSELMASVQRLEKRIYELEHVPHPAETEHDGTNGVSTKAELPAPGTAVVHHTNGGADAPAAQITLLLGKGQSLLNMDKAEEALACFDEVLGLDPNHPEALVKKGTALERLRKLNEAIECYDRAIEADGTMTIAYLYKGGLFNRMERFSEALECYEKALRTQEKR